MDWSIMRKVGPTGTIRALSAHFETFAFTRHEHDHFVVGLIGSGLQSFELGRNTYVTPPGYLMLINPGEPHTGQAAREGGFSYLALYPTLDDLRLFAEDSDLRSSGCFSFRRTHVRDASVHAGLWRALGEGIGDPLAQETAFVGVLRELLRRHATCEGHPTGPIRARREVLRARDHLHAHLEERVTLSELARVAGLSPYHLARLFTDAFGLPPHKYLEGLRVRLAQRLLAEGRPPVDAALAAGFSSQSHLNRSFKRILGVTPTAYR